MPTITPFLWFDKEAEAAANFYVSIFPNSKILKVVRNPAGAPGPEGAVLVVDFELDGQRYTALNGGPHHKFSEAISFVVHGKDQAETDRYWNALLEGGRPDACGWLKDRYGLSWQVVPDGFVELIADPNPERAGRAMTAMMGMVKLDIDALRRAVEG
jgi:predicted 3-demethylubiquinone-9 3-methyltransferase (glyoxalase superfamily)